MEQAVKHLEECYAGIRAGKATPGLVKHVKVECYGSLSPLEHIAAINAPETRLLVVQPYDSTLIIEVEKAILKSGLGLTTNRTNSLVRISVPPLSEDRRQELAKHAKHLAEQQRVAVRNLRRDALKSIQKVSSSEDQKKIAVSEVESLTKVYVSNLDELEALKVRDILGLDNHWK